MQWEQNFLCNCTIYKNSVMISFQIFKVSHTNGSLLYLILVFVLTAKWKKRKLCLTLDLGPFSNQNNHIFYANGPNFPNMLNFFEENSIFQK